MRDHTAEIAEYMMKAQDKAVSDDPNIAAWGRMEIATAEPILRWLEAEMSRQTPAGQVSQALIWSVAEYVGGIIRSVEPDPAGRREMADQAADIFAHALRKAAGAESQESEVRDQGSGE